MNCLITAGPTYEPLDRVRRLTNFSTGRLGCELATFLTARGHSVTLLLGEQATYRGEWQAGHTEIFSTTTDLRQRLESRAGGSVEAVFHAAAVSDFSFGSVWQRAEDGRLIPVHAEKIPTREANLLVELQPTVKIIASLRNWFPRAVLIGWKYEMDDDRAAVLRKAEAQLTACRTDACVANGAAYGEGFGLVTSPGTCVHQRDKAELFVALETLLNQRRAQSK